MGSLPVEFDENDVKLAFKFRNAIEDGNLKLVNEIINSNKTIACLTDEILSQMKIAKNKENLVKLVENRYVDLKDVPGSNYKEFCLNFLKVLVSEEAQKPSIWELIESNNNNEIIELLDQKPSVLNSKNNLQECPILYAIKTNKFAIAILLLTYENIDTYCESIVGNIDKYIKDYIRNEHWKDVIKNAVFERRKLQRQYGKEYPTTLL